MMVESNDNIGHSVVERFNNYSNFAESVCRLRKIPRVIGDYKVTDNDYNNHRYLDALARIIACSGKCIAVFIKMSMSSEATLETLKSQVENTKHVLTPHIEKLKDDELQIHKINDLLNYINNLPTADTESLSTFFQTVLDSLKNIMQCLQTGIKDNAENKEFLITIKPTITNLLESYEKIYDNYTVPTLYIATNSNVDPLYRRLIEFIMKGIKQSLQEGNPEILVKVAALANPLLVSNIRSLPSLMKPNIPEEELERIVELSEQLNDCVAELRKSKTFPEDKITEVSYQTMVYILKLKEMPTEFNSLIRRVFQDGLKLFHTIKNINGIPLIKYEIITNPTNLHAEIALINKIILDGEISILTYVGISKLCCALCDYTLNLLCINHLGTHNNLYAGDKEWKLCGILTDEDKNQLEEFLSNYLISKIDILRENLKCKKEINETLNDQHPYLSDDEELEREIKIGKNEQTLWNLKYEHNENKYFDIFCIVSLLVGLFVLFIAYNLR